MIRRILPHRRADLCLLLLAALCLLGTVLAGVAAGVASAFPVQAALGGWSMRILRPLHELLALFWLYLGIAGCVGLWCRQDDAVDRWLANLGLGLYLAFLVSALLALYNRPFSGREYMPWPPALSPLLLLALLYTAARVLRAWPRLVAHSREAAWFLALGVLLLPLGYVESLLYLWGSTPARFGLDLSVQWHALDSVITAWCISLYGLGMLILPAQSKPMRCGWLFLMAAIGILLDFGHHNYPSPQHIIIKWVSFSATMLGSVSFIRHVRALRTSRPSDDMTSMLHAVEYWILGAVGSGILMAIPWVNLYVHGTYVVVAHTMGAMIGVNSLLLFTVAFALLGTTHSWRRSAVRWFNGSLLAFCLVLTILGICRGIWRIDLDELLVTYRLRPWLLAIPLAAIPLTLSLLVLTWDLIRGCGRGWNASSPHD